MPAPWIRVLCLTYCHISSSEGNAWHTAGDWQIRAGRRGMSMGRFQRRKGTLKSTEEKGGGETNKVCTVGQHQDKGMAFPSSTSPKSVLGKYHPSTLQTKNQAWREWVMHKVRSSQHRPTAHALSLSCLHAPSKAGSFPLGLIPGRS